MTKTIAQIYIDVHVKEYHKSIGTNISAVCNEFLKTYLNQDEPEGKQDFEKEMQTLRAKLAQTNAKLEAQKKNLWSYNNL